MYLSIACIRVLSSVYISHSLIKRHIGELVLFINLKGEAPYFSLVEHPLLHEWVPQ